MARKYTVVGSNLTVAGATTLAFIRPPASGLKEIKITKVEVSFSDNATSAQTRVQLVTQVTAFPTLTAATPQPLDLGQPASLIVGGTAGAAGTAGVNASVEGAGAKTVRYEAAFNNLNGWLWVPTVEGEITLPVNSASGFGVYLPAAPATLTGWSVSVEFEEV